MTLRAERLRAEFDRGFGWGGDLGWRSPDEIPTAFVEMLKGMSPGQVVGPLRGRLATMLRNLAGPADRTLSLQWAGIAQAPQRLRDGVPPSAIGTIATVGYGIAIWALSQGSMAHVTALRETSALFGALIGADTLPTRKPDPAPYVASVQRAGGDVARSMLIGDTETDRKTGLAVGVPVALVTFGPEGRAIERLEPEALLDHFDDLPGLALRLLK